MAKVYAKIKAIALREEGHSYNYIASALGVSKSIVSVWLAHVPYTPNQETIDRMGNARAASGAAKSRLKRESIARAKKHAMHEMGVISKRDLFMLGLGLYLGEGTKVSSMVRLANADPRVIRLAVRWFHETCGVPRSHFRVRLHIYPDCNEEQSLQFWSNQLKIPRGQFMKSMIDRRTSKKVAKAGKLPHGTEHLTVRTLGHQAYGVFLKRKIDAWLEKVLG